VVIESVKVAVPAVANAATGRVLNVIEAVVISAAVAAFAGYMRGTIRYHAVPSLAIAQSRVPPVGSGQNRFSTIAVFGVAVWFLNVTVFEDPIAHEPLNVQTRNIFGAF
jgi:hypothetical protein